MKQTRTQNQLQKFAQTSLWAKLPPSQVTGGFASNVFWDEDFFQVGKTTVFQEMNAAQRESLLESCGRMLLVEAYFIEKIGMSYAARMILQSESTDERMFYCGMAAEEARHFARIQDFVKGSVDDQEAGPFIDLLNDIVLGQSREVLLYIVQIVLEGWGLTHYRNLAKGSSNHDLTEFLQAVIRDEARHHGGGVVSFEKADLKSSQTDALLNILERFVTMVRIGPQGVLARMEQAIGHNLTHNERIQTLSQMEALNTTSQRLDLLKHLGSKDQKGNDLITRLNDKIFSPLSIEEMAGIL